MVQPDIDKYVSYSLDQVPGRGTEAHNYALQKIAQAADGMFLFAALGIQSVRQAIDQQSLMDAVNHIPDGIDGLYGNALEKIPSQSIQRLNLARNILIWVCCCPRPLSWKELQTALSWDDIKEEFVEDKRPFKDVVLDLCIPLVEYRPSKDTFHVTHFSVKEYLCNSNESRSLSAAATQLLIRESYGHQLITEVALASLSMPETIHKVDVDFRHYPLVRYSTENWCFHLASSSYDPKLRKKYLEFVSLPNSRSTWILRFMISKKESFPLQRIAKLQKAVHIWEKQSSLESEDTTFIVDDLVDIQRSLIEMDKLTNQTELISNFERNLMIRDLARAYAMVGKLDQGIKLFLLALQQGSQTQGEPATTWLLHGLGILYDQQGLKELAFDTQYRALKIEEKHLPQDHLDITLTLNELGRMSRHLGKFKEAEEYHLRALTILRRFLPESDLQVIWTISTLARSYRKEGRTDEALTLHRQALNGQIKLLGNEHPHTLWTEGDIARCLRDQDHIKEALDMLRVVYEGRVRSLGQVNPDTLWTLNDMGLLLEMMGQMKEALMMHTEALEGQTKVLGKEHAHMLWTAAKLEKLREAVEKK
jgi:tetratricopeptide (TPR) repeat protein